GAWMPQGAQMPQVFRTLQALQTPRVFRTLQALRTPRVFRTPQALRTPRVSQALLAPQERVWIVRRQPS
ncbi:MAG: hypothetical protein WAM44_09220, partial [Chthoniobacterales bacterium]